jgi:hypothetical protein
VGGLEEVRRLELKGKGESITQEYADKVAFRGDVIRRDHGLRC